MTRKEVVTRTVTTRKIAGKRPAKKKRKAAGKRPAQKIVIQHAPPQSKVDSALIENFVSLQRVLTNLSVKLDNVATQMSKLLDLFEISAKAIAEKDFDLGKGNKEVLERLDNLLDQNKTLARGLTLMHERIPQETYPIQQQMRLMSPIPQQNFQPPMPQKQEMQKPRESGPARTFAKEIDEEPYLEPPQFESPL